MLNGAFMKLSQLRFKWAGVAEAAKASQIHRSRGDDARNRGDWHSARLAYESHLKQQPHDFAIWVQLGHALKESGFFQQSLAAYHEARDLIPDDPDLLISMGHLHKRMGNFDLAITYYSQSADVAPGLFAGAALIEIEKMIARIVWRESEDRLSFPKDLQSLAPLISREEATGKQIFSDYFRSFQMR